MPFSLTHSGRVTHICASKQGHHRSRKWLVAWSAPSHYLNRWWNIVNWTLSNKVRWNRKQNSCIFIQENAYENVVWKMASILSRPQCVKMAPVNGGHFAFTSYINHLLPTNFSVTVPTGTLLPRSTAINGDVTKPEWQLVVISSSTAWLAGWLT